MQTLPLLGVLRRRFPTATVSWVVRRDLADLITGHPDLTEVIPFNRDGTWSESWQLLGLLKRRRFDLVFDLQGLFRTGVMTFATGAALRVGLETGRKGANLACNCIVPDTGRNVPAALARYRAWPRRWAWPTIRAWSSSRRRQPIRPGWPGSYVLNHGRSWQFIRARLGHETLAGREIRRDRPALCRFGRGDRGRERATGGRANYRRDGRFP